LYAGAKLGKKFYPAREKRKYLHETEKESGHP
jgi:hypothetical protein